MLRRHRLNATTAIPECLSENPGVRLCRPRPAAGNTFHKRSALRGVLRLVCDTAALLFQTGSESPLKQFTSDLIPCQPAVETPNFNSREKYHRQRPADTRRAALHPGIFSPRTETSPAQRRGGTQRRSRRAIRVFQTRAPTRRQVGDRKNCGRRLIQIPPF